MKRSLRKATSLLLTAAFMLSLVAMLPISALADGTAPTITGATGQFLVNVVTDPATNGETPDGFGTKDSDGRIWTDKTVKANSDGASFDVTLSVLAQQYESTLEAAATDGSSGGAGTESVAADVTFVLDMSTSMATVGTPNDIDNGNGGTYYRIEAMVLATNEAIATIMEANPNNRVAVHWFGGNYNEGTGAHVGTFMPMDSYTFKSDASNKTDYLLWSSSNKGQITINSGLEAAGNSSTAPKTAVHGTPTQSGIIYGIQNMIASINNETPGAIGTRQPFVFLLSDGAAIAANANWWVIPNDPTNPASYDKSRNNINNTETKLGTKTVAAATILAAAHQKELLTDAYQTYNGYSSSDDVGLAFYTVGLGSGDAINGDTNHAWCGLNPAGLAEDYYRYKTVDADGNESGTRELLNEADGTSALDTKNQIKDYIAAAKTSDSTNADYYDSFYKEDGGVISGKFIYSTYYRYSDTYPQLSKVFTDFAKQIEAATEERVVQFPVSGGNTTSGADSLDGAATFTDELGDGLTLGTIKLGDVTGVFSDTENEYTFEGYKSVVTLEEDELVWSLNAEDMYTAMYRLPENSGDPYTAGTPLQLTYTLSPTSSTPGDAKDSLYSNASAKATFTPTLDNPYYYETSSDVGKVLDTDPENENLYYSGTEIGNDSYANLTGDPLIYTTSGMVQESGGKIPASNIGLLISKAKLDEIIDEMEDAEQDSSLAFIAEIEESFILGDTGSNAWGFKTGVAKENPEPIAITDPVAGGTVYSSSTALEEGLVTTTLGNNGRLDFVLGIAKSGPTTAMKGSTVTYTIKVYNYSDDALTNVTVTDTMSPGATFAADTTAKGVATFTNTGIPTWTIGSIAAGESATLTFTATLDSNPEPGDTVENYATATVTASDNSPVSVSSNTVTTTPTDGTAVDIAVKLDGRTWTGDDPEPPSITLRPEGATDNTTDIDDLSDVSTGTYKVLVEDEEGNLVDTGKTVTVGSDGTVTGDKTLDYYTLTLKAGANIEEVGIDTATGTDDVSLIVPKGTEVNINATIADGYVWDKWTTSTGGSAPDSTSSADTTVTVDSTTTLTASGKSKGGGGGGYTPPTITTPASTTEEDKREVDDSGKTGDPDDVITTDKDNKIVTIRPPEGGSGGSIKVTSPAEDKSPSGNLTAHKPGDKVTVTITPDPGYYVRDVIVNGQRMGGQEFLELVVIEDMEIVPLFGLIVALNREDHYAYVIGYPDGNVRPHGLITREEAATIFFRLLRDDSRDTFLTYTNSFSDVDASRWSNCAISTMAKAGIIQGRSDSEFAPGDYITRAELAAIASRFDALTYEEVDFTDISGHWAYDEIRSAATRGWVTGYEDSSFKPNQPITRAETMTLINRVLVRLPQSPADLLDAMTHWPDNADTGIWYYLPVQEATNSHNYDAADHESWTTLRETRNWLEFEVAAP